MSLHPAFKLTFNTAADIHQLTIDNLKMERGNLERSLARMPDNMVKLTHWAIISLSECIAKLEQTQRLDLPTK